MLRDELKALVDAAIARLIQSGQLPDAVREVPIEISDTKSPEHGDYACNFALAAAKKASLPPRQVGELLRTELLSTTASPSQDGSGANSESASERPEGGLRPAPFVAIDVAGPGFINLKLNPAYVASFVEAVLAKGTGFAHPPRTDPPQRINVEFVSVNPNGPITVGSGRGAAFGSTLANVLAAAGNTVHREYYINDGVNSEQMRLFAESVKSYALGQPFPEKGYKGEYVKDVAAAIDDSPADAGIGWWQSRSQDLMLARQRNDLATFGVQFDMWFSEQSLHDRGEVAKRIEELTTKGVADEEPYRTVLKLAKNGKIDEVQREEQPVEEVDEEFGETAATSDTPSSGSATLWLRSTKFGDDMDRVLRRKDGRLTYIASDVAYHANKLARPEPGADKLITILGPDHHGYIGRLQAVFAALLEGSYTERSGASAPLNDAEALIYRSEEERNACLAALDEAKRRLEVVIFQIVRFVKDGKPAPMRKRDGNIYELRDLIDELGKNIAPSASLEEQQRIGADVSRFFYLMRSHDTHMDFDIDLATKQSDENPVFYAQYAHARICSVLRKADELGLSSEAGGIDAGQLADPRETALIKKILDLPMEVGRSAKDYGVHRLTTFAVELARAYHHFYDGCRVIQADQPELTKARLALCRATRLALQATFDLLGVSAPQKMEREA